MLTRVFSVACAATVHFEGGGMVTFGQGVGTSDPSDWLGAALRGRTRVEAK